MGNLNKPSEYIVFQMNRQIYVGVALSEVSEC